MQVGLKTPGVKPGLNRGTGQGESTVSGTSPKSVDNLRTDDDGAVGAPKNRNTLIIVGIVVAVIIVIGFLGSSLGKSSDAKQPQMVGGNATTAPTTVASVDSSQVDGNAGNSDGNLGTDTAYEDGTATPGPNAIYDADGNVISSNGVYDADGNVVGDGAINPGLPNFNDSEQGTTTATVFSATDFIKDLNGVDVPAVYNVKSRDYINDFVNYEAKRAIMADGLELYWLEVTYNDKPYRVQVPFYIFKDLKQKGICVVEIEQLTLEGGEKIISYMSVVYDYANMINEGESK